MTYVTSAADLLDVLRRSDVGSLGPPDAEPSLLHLERLSARAARHAPWPDWAPPEVVSAFRRTGIAEPYGHQVTAAELAHDGQHVVLATGTASGKSVGYQLPALSDLVTDQRATVLYLSPTKALAADQVQALAALGLPGVHPCLFDGDTAIQVRDWARSHSRWLLTNPDMIHRAMLPQHPRWARFLRRLRYLVIDECHVYRGVFGAHVALVLRRLLRVAAHYGAHPTVVLASATVGDPAVAASRLVGEPVVAVSRDDAPRPGAEFVLWQPPLVDSDNALNGSATRRPAATEAAQLMAELVAAGGRVLTFVRSRQSAELAAMTARRRLDFIAPELADRVAAYRAGYLPEERRELERSLNSADVLGLATTNALELGIDIAGLDAVILVGYPGTLASLWQQAGRAGRRDSPGLVVFVAREDPLDRYLLAHPEAIFSAQLETSVVHPDNPYLLRQHLTCSASELPLTASDLGRFGIATASCLADLVTAGELRLREGRWFHTGLRHPGDDVDLRGSGGDQVAIVETGTARMLGTVGAGRAASTVHQGAVYLHRGVSYLVDRLDHDEGLAYVHEAAPGYTTAALSTTDVTVTRGRVQRKLASGWRAGLAEIEVTGQVIGYLRRRPSGAVIDQTALDMPVSTLPTVAVWFSVPTATALSSGLTAASIPGALHAIEHVGVALLPLFADCDRSDLGGFAAVAGPETGDPTVMVYDAFPGGAGFAEHGFQVLLTWVQAAAAAVASCRCAEGCPACVQSARCGSGNEPLDKAGAAILLRAFADALREDRHRR